MIAFGSFSYDENNEYCAEFTPMERLLLKHGAMQELLTQADVAEMLDIDEGEITTITLGGRKYYRTDTEKPNYDYGFPITVPMTFLFHFTTSQSVKALYRRFSLALHFTRTMAAQLL